MDGKKGIVILGSTGSIGESAFWVAQQLSDRLKILGLAAGRRWQRLAQQGRALGCRHLAIAEPGAFQDLRASTDGDVKVTVDPDHILDMVTASDVDMVLCAITGTAGLQPVLAAIKAGKDIALASKEILVMAGDLVTAEVERHGVRMIPVDSEHSAIFQCLEGARIDSVRRLILTASGGPFRETPSADLAWVTPEQALDHPTWNMGPKITIDSATLFNKALEIIEAHSLFGVEADQIDVLVHPQSVIHSIVEFIDGSMLAQLGLPDMKLPIQYALLYPERVDTGLTRCDLASLASLTFVNPRHDDFPALRLAGAALRTGGTMPTVLNAANEVAVEAFRNGELGFKDIGRVVEGAMVRHRPLRQSNLEEVLAADAWARAKAREEIASLA